MGRGGVDEEGGVIGGGVGVGIVADFLEQRIAIQIEFATRRADGAAGRTLN